MNELPPLRDYRRSRAVLIGTWDYAFLNPVPAAKYSLKRMASLLTGPLCGWPQGRLLVLPNVPSPGDLLDQTITAFEAAEDVAVFYFVGHGQLSHDDQLCLGLTQSRTESNRRAVTSLRFPDVRDALLDGNARVKIVILDCCFAGLATKSTLASDVLDLTAGTGAYTMAATGAHATAWYQDGPGLPEPQTYFTKYLADLVEEGIPGQPARLRMDPLFKALREKLAADRCPIPRSRAVDDARDFEFAYNVAPPPTHHAPEQEMARLSLRLAESQSLVARLQESLASSESRGIRQQRELSKALDEAARQLDETRAAQGALTTVRPDQPTPTVTAPVTEKISPRPRTAIEPGKHARKPGPPTAAPPTAGVLTEANVTAPDRSGSANSWIEPKPSSQRPKQQDEPPPREKPRHRQIVLLCLAGLCFIVVVIVLAMPSGPANHAPTRTIAYPSGANADEVAISPSGKTVAAASSVPGPTSNDVYLWNTSSGDSLGNIGVSGNAGVNAMAFNPDGTLLAGATSNGVDLWDVRTATTVSTLNSNLQSVAAVAFTPDGGIVAYTADYGEIYLWDTKTRRQVLSFSASNISATSLAFSPNGKALAVGYSDGSAQILNASTGHLLLTLKDQATQQGSTCGDSITGIAFSPNGKTLAGGNCNGSTYLWNPVTGQETTTLADPGSSPSVGGVAFTDSGALAVADIGEDTTYLWDVSTRKVTATLTDPTSGMAASSRGTTLATVGNTGDAYIWSVNPARS